MLTLTLCAAALFLLALIALVLFVVGLPFTVLFFALLPIALLPVGFALFLWGLIYPGRRADALIPGAVLLLLGSAMLFH